MCTKTNYKFDNYSFIVNIEHYEMIEKTDKIVEAAKVKNKTTNHGTNYKSIKVR